MIRRMASIQVDKVTRTYKAIAEQPSLSKARIIEVTSKGALIQSIWSQRNLERRTTQKFIQNHTLDSDLKLISESFPIDVTTELMSVNTEDNERRAVLRQATVENTQKQFIEIWDKYHLVKNYDLSALDVHKDVYTDLEFSCFEWSPDKTKLLYIAEKKLPKSEPFYKQKSLSEKHKEEEKENETTVGNEHIYKPDWGEQLVGKHLPVVVVLDTVADTLTPLSGIPDELSPGQVLWAKNGKDVVGVAWKHEPRRLGLIACSSRYSWIFLLKDGEYQKLSTDGCAVRSPRFSPNGKYLVWLERQAGGPHHNAHRLMYMDFEAEEKKAEILIDITKRCTAINGEKEFYGLYGRLPRRCWSNDSRYLFFSTPQQCNVKSYVVDIDTKSITELQNDKSSLSILDVKNDVIAFLEVSHLKPSSLLAGFFSPQVLSSGNITKVQISTPKTLPGFEELTYEYTKYIYDNGDPIREFNFIYFGPKFAEDKSVPLLIVPHGGPHSNYVTTFQIEYSLFALMGMAMLQVNYRGSTGMGSDNVEFLQGRVGDADVKDCVTATKEALRKYPWLDPARVGLIGGSHGGFLVTHLSGQYPDLYKAVVARNPVIEVATMFNISDIPDWCAAVTKYPYDYDGMQRDRVTMAAKMLSHSPIMHVDKVKAPTLLCIGKNDLRVPCSQGILWYHQLKANGVTVKMLVYDDNHPLDSAVAEIDCAINSCLWLLKYVAGK